MTWREWMWATFAWLFLLGGSTPGKVTPVIGPGDGYAVDDERPGAPKRFDRKDWK